MFIRFSSVCIFTLKDLLKQSPFRCKQYFLCNRKFARDSLSSLSSVEPVMKYLNVAEKNDAAKNIAGHLSRGTSQRREGLSTYNKIYQFEAEVFGQKSTMVMTSVSGHLLGYEFVGSYRIWKSCNPLTLFEAPLAKFCPEDYQKIKQTLEREVRSCQGLIIWTDCDREGENIGFEIIKVCTDVKPNLKIYRAKFSEITSQSVTRALHSLGAPNKNISDAVDVRQELDLRIGAAFTRFQTMRLQRMFPNHLASSLVSYGSCQFPTLGFVVERYRAVQNFIPENFWKIKVSHTMNDLTVDFNWKRHRLFDEQACVVIYDVCAENPTATVKTTNSKPKSKWRPLPLDTIELEKLGSRKLHINAKETMKIAEKLYTQGIISYPRTETNKYPPELNLGNLVQLQTEDQAWGSFAQGILNAGGPTPRQGNKSDQAHPPIHPTKHVTNLSGNEKKVYDLIVRSFLACCSKDAQGQETVVEVDIAWEMFTASGLMIIARNYLDVYPYDKWSAKEIHVYREGDTFLPTQMDVVGSQTSAPKLLTEADLIALMEKHGIGTDATHADHIETIKSRSYVAVSDNFFIPSLLGMGLVEGYDAMGTNFSKPDLRAGLEADLKEVCEGRKPPDVVLAQQVSKYKEVFITVTQDAVKIDQALGERFNQTPAAITDDNPSETNVILPSVVMKCPKCKSDMTLRTKKDGQGYYVGCMGFPNCKNVLWFPGNVVDKVQVTNSSCEECGPSTFKLEFRWKGRSLEHIYPSPHTCCIGGCDTHILQTLNINISNLRSNPYSQNNPINAQRNPSSNSRNNISNDSGYVSHNSWTMGSSTSSNGGSNNSRSSNNVPRNNNDNNRPRNGLNNDGAPRNNMDSSNRPRNDASNNDWPRNSSSNDNGPRNNMNAPRNNMNKDNQPHSGWSGALMGDGDNNSVVCNCGESALLLTAGAKSKNPGRQFYKCNKPSDACNFFLWAESENNSVTSTDRRNNQAQGGGPGSSWGSSQQNTNWNSNWQNNDNSGNTNSWGETTGTSWGDAENSSTPRCKCNLPTKRLKCGNGGPNHGREFHKCPQSSGNGCNFFEWVNDDGGAPTSWGAEPSSSRGGGSRGRGKGRGGNPGRGGNANRGGASSSEDRTRRKCGNCREEGHTRNKCPRLN